jgi:O-antigen ligase
MISTDGKLMGMSAALLFLAALLLLLAYVVPTNAFILSLSSVLWGVFYNNYFAFASLLVFVAALFSIKQNLLLTSESIGLLCVAVIPLLQWVFGVIFFGGDALVAFAYIFCATLALVSGVTTLVSGHRERILYGFSLVFLIVGLLSFYMALYQFLRLGYAEEWIFTNTLGGRIFGNIRQPNNFSSMQLMSLLCAWYLFEKNAYSKKIWLLVSVCILVSTVLAQSRTAILAAILILFFFLFYRKKIQFRVDILDLLLFFIVYAVLRLIFESLLDTLFYGGGDLADKMKNVYQFADGARYFIWFDSLRAIVDGPLWGYGWNQVGMAQVLLDGGLYTSHFRQSHNLFLDIILWNGPIVGSFLCLMVFVLIFRSICYCRSLEGWILLAIVGVVFTHAMLEYPLHYAFFLLPIAFLVGLFDRPQDQRVVGLPIPPVLTFMIILGGAFFLSAVFNEYNILERQGRSMNMDSGLYQVSIDKPEKLDEVVLLTHLQALVRLSRKEITPTITDEEITWIKKVSYRFPSAYTLAIYAKACRYSGRNDEVARVLDVIDRVFEDKYTAIAKSIIYDDTEKN